jgi:hypothetical protein
MRYPPKVVTRGDTFPQTFRTRTCVENFTETRHHVSPDRLQTTTHPNYLEVQQSGGQCDRVMKTLLTAFALACTAHAAPPEVFWLALHQIESSSRLGAIKGDGGAALGPLQIHRGYHEDSRVPGRYEQVANLAYARRVAEAYFQRYAPDAWAKGDMETLARIHNGGPKGHHKAATLPYAKKFMGYVSQFRARRPGG